MSLVGPLRLCCLILALLVSAGALRAANETREQRTFDTAVAAFHDQLWNVAEIEFADFIQKYPNSELMAQAGVLEAQAAIKQGKFAAAETLLLALRPKAGKLADDCTYWLGEAQFGNGELQPAAATLASLPKTSPLALRGAVEAGDAMAELGQWPQLTNYFLLDQDLFQNEELTDADNELLLRGRLLLAQANFAEKQYAAAARLLADIKPKRLPPELEWKRLCLLCQVRLAAHAADRSAPLDSALALAGDLLAAAKHLPASSMATNQAASLALRAEVLEQLGRTNEARLAYAENLSTNAPEELQRQAMLKIAALAISGREYTNAEATLGAYLSQFTNAPARDVALLTQGELYLNDYASQTTATNLLAAARARFEELLASQPNSLFAGKAWLDRGWCGWLAALDTNAPPPPAELPRIYADCLTNFQNAAQRLPASEDLAVARFKLADTYFVQGDMANALTNFPLAQWDYANALTNYHAVLALTNQLPAILPALGNIVLYQTLRAQLDMTNLAEAAITMALIAPGYPESELSQSGTLLLGEGYTDLRQPQNALALFRKFLKEVPLSPLRPKVALAIARAYEQVPDWTAAIGEYQTWLKDFPTNDLLPDALYARAWASAQAGDDTNALMLFTNFVARFPLHPEAPSAQWWVADYYFNSGDSVAAEKNYKLISQNTNWQSSPLHYWAYIMAGRAVLYRTENSEAIRDYFEKLEADTNCPPDLRLQAMFLHGSALMKMDPEDTNNPTRNFSEAAKVFYGICQLYPTNEPGARAWGELGDCYLQLHSYNNASNSFCQAMLFAGTNTAIRDQAQVGLGVVLEKMAALLTNGPDQLALQTQAEANYWEVLNAVDERNHELGGDLTWNEVAGLKAAELAAGLGKWQDAARIYEEMLQLMPESKELARKLAAAKTHLETQKK